VVGDLDLDDAVSGSDRDRDRPPGGARAAVPHAITEQLARQQNSDLRARVRRAEHRAHERAGHPCPLRPPGHRHALPNRRLTHPATALPAPRPAPGRTGARGGARGCTLDSAAHVKPGYATSAARPWLSVLPDLAPGAIWELRDSDDDDDE
jgi:hypothetical protein